MVLSRAMLSVVAAAGLAIAGCGEPGVVRPTGRILDRGAPVEGATIRFRTDCDSGHCDFDGVADDAGRYRLDYGVRPGIPPGPTEVTISRPLLRDGSPLPPGEEGAHLLETGRAVRETWRFEIELDRGARTLDFDLAEGERVTD